MSAAEPEAMLVDMMDQLIAANTPEDIQFRIIEPTIPLTGYKNSPYVAQYMDSWTPNNKFMSNARSMMEEAVTEMNRRYALMINHPETVYNLGKAREVAIRESNQAGTPLEDHPLWMPHIFIVVHEAASLFSESTLKDEHDEQQSLVFATAELARKSRAAGIYLVMSTQVSVAVPPVIRDQMRMIALSTPSEHYSTVAVGDDSLVGLPKNKGIVVGKGEDENTVFDRNPIRY
jgi:DNA segregation ATPase FtsK/SpoIIIE-like protein